jgi:hypothetical protein
MAQREGYLLIDHQASPGIPEEMAAKLGMDPKQVAEGKVLEAGTVTCAHCKGVVLKNPWRTRERYNCPKCSFKYLCDACAAAARQPDYNHTPFEKQADDVFEAAVRSMTLGSPSKLLMP